MNVKAQMPKPKVKTTATLKQRKLPQQERSKLTIDRILQGTEDVMHQKGVRAVTTPAIAKAAGVNVASIYQYFPNKEAIIQALYENKLLVIRNGVDELLDSIKLASWKSDVYQVVLTVKRIEREIRFDKTIVEASQYYELLDSTWRSHATVVARSITRMLQRLGSTWSEKALYDIAVYIFSLSMATWDFWRLRNSEPDTGLHQQATATVALISLALESREELEQAISTAASELSRRTTTKK